MELGETELKIIAEYVKNHIPQWLKEADIIPKDYSSNTLLVERVVRVEEMRHDMIARFEQIDRKFEMLLHQMDKMFEQVDKRFEQVDKRFEQVDKRFEQVDKRFEQVDKRFEDLRHDMNSRFNMMYKLMASGFALLAFLITLFQYI